VATLVSGYGDLKKERNKKVVIVETDSEEEGAAERVGESGRRLRVREAVCGFERDDRCFLITLRSINLHCESA
jgi:hypothetical protein